MNATNLKSGKEVREVSESELSELNVFDPGEIDSFDAIDGEVDGDDSSEPPTGDGKSEWVDGNGNPVGILDGVSSEEATKAIEEVSLDIDDDFIPVTGSDENRNAAIGDPTETHTGPTDSTPPASEGDAAGVDPTEEGEVGKVEGEKSEPEPVLSRSIPATLSDPISAFEQIQSMQAIVQEISETEFGIEQTKAAAKELKARRDSLHLELRGMVMDFRSGQKRLEFGNSDRPREPKEAGVVGVGTKLELTEATGDGSPIPTEGETEGQSKSKTPDPALNAPIHDLQPFGLTESQCDKWHDGGIERICDLEKAMNEDRLGLVVKDTKGLGGKSIDKVVDALLEWRKVNPAT